jgi:hypothetical protein
LEQLDELGEEEEITGALLVERRDKLGLFWLAD